MVSDKLLRQFRSADVIQEQELLMNGVNSQMIADTHDHDPEARVWRRKRGSSGEVRETEQRTTSEPSEPGELSEPFRLKLRSNQLNLSTVIAVYDSLAPLNLGGVCFADLVKALEAQGVHICNDIPQTQPFSPESMLCPIPSL